MKQLKSAMTCREILLAFSRYLDGEQSLANCRRIERHLKSCASCAAATDQIRAVVTSCRRMNKTHLPDDVRARAAQRVKELLGSSPPDPEP